MSQYTDPANFIFLSAHLPVIDVRSPGEFSKGHIPGAFNLPLFDNEERAMIGTLYVQSGRDIAIKEGMELVGRKFSRFIGEIERLVPGKEMLLHCWRGGMRSESLAWFFEKLGYKVTLLEGGYKSYRRFIRQEFSKPVKIILIGGMTGSGKTELLNRIGVGEQTIDLEAMASHKGSSFGHLGQDQQPSTEQFENDLFASWNSIDPGRLLWLEHESKQIGKIFLPDPFYAAMLNGILLKINLPVHIRVQRLVKEYACFDLSLLQEVVVHLKQNMGTLQSKLAMEALSRNDFETVAGILLEYYDKTYENALKNKPVRVVHTIELESADMEENSSRLLEFVKTKNILNEF
jgi:tRNA 2-selenouridine synthase